MRRSFQWTLILGVLLALTFGVAASASICPHDAVPVTPTPRNDSDASSRMLAGMNSVV